MAIPTIIPSFPNLDLIGGTPYSAQTVGAMTKVLQAFPIADGFVVKYNASVQAIATDKSLKLGFERNTIAINNAGIVTEGLPHSPFTDKDGSVADMYWQVNGTNMELILVGVIGKTINWTGTVKIQKVSI